MNFELRAVPKPKHKRFKRTAKERGRITSEVYEAALERSGGRCERCGKCDYLQCAHLIRRWKVEVETTVNDVAMLCGPSVNTGTCHNIIDYTQAGKEWAEEYRDRLYRRAKINE
ncbi:HNH endonuclease [Paenibacillus sp. ACRRY]|uniref:HNH endonuclease n=1 Tax=Paenibacillus sp. ACRRY TaxID=2918208 RepID=UPI001EF64215|nr:HNH endonuclease [Paenibacillus sp. ACRRY]MCG7385063.1 HNH endonuclease [Paenibacillus sp. ACRRY]